MRFTPRKKRRGKVKLENSWKFMVWDRRHSCRLIDKGTTTPPYHDVALKFTFVTCLIPAGKAIAFRLLLSSDVVVVVLVEAFSGLAPSVFDVNVISGTHSTWVWRERASSQPPWVSAWDWRYLQGSVWISSRGLSAGMPADIGAVPLEPDRRSAAIFGWFCASTEMCHILFLFGHRMDGRILIKRDRRLITSN